jgi:hypothetical protein
MQRPACRQPCAPSTSAAPSELLHRRFAAPRRWARSAPFRPAASALSSSDDDSAGPDLGWSSNFVQHYVKGRALGAGSFGTVYLGIDLRTGHEVAVKVLPKIRGKLTKERTLAKIHKEASILSRLQDCSNVVQLLGLYEHEHEVLVVTELCKGGDLQKLFEVRAGPAARTHAGPPARAAPAIPRGPAAVCPADGGAAAAPAPLQSHRHGLSERAVALIAFEVLKVVAACHGLGILHGDIKPANFVLKHSKDNPVMGAEQQSSLQGPWLKAIDFGCGQVVDGGWRCGQLCPPLRHGPRCLLRRGRRGRRRRRGEAAAWWLAGLQGRSRARPERPLPAAPVPPRRDAALHQAQRHAGVHGARDLPAQLLVRGGRVVAGHHALPARHAPLPLLGHL